MPRRKPASIKQKKAKLQLKRAVKRGEVLPTSARPEHRPARRKTPAGDLLGQPSRNTAPAESARRLQSAFIKLPQSFLVDTKLLSATLPLIRPIPLEAAILPYHDRHTEDSTALPSQLTCLKRPKWKYDMSKEEVQSNEEGLFQKWLAQTDAAVNEWCSLPSRETANANECEETEEPEPEALAMPRAPTSFERNLEVWRQLWRVTEISQILLILLDSRCPVLHYPPSLHAYLSSTPHLATRTRTILVLTKVDIAGPVRAEAWTKYLHEQYPGLRIVQVEAYAEKARSDAAAKRTAHEPHLPSAFRQTLVETLRAAHAELLEPPEHIRDHPEIASRWKPPVKRDVDWDTVLKAEGDQVGTVVGGATAPRAQQEQTLGDNSEDEEVPDFLTVGLIGQPNVGKSSLLNALFGTHKVKASKSPGKTKHFQTLFWTPDVRLVDCPGLVMPNFTRMEMQVLSGILPISRVSAVPLCIYHAAQLLPLERIYNLVHPSPASAAVEDKRTWRDGMHPHAQGKQIGPGWTAMDILTAYALRKGWFTAMAGWPDVSRAGNAILRALAEGRIRWAFWPPGTDLQTIQDAQQEGGSGIWIPHSAGGENDESDSDNDDGDAVIISEGSDDEEGTIDGDDEDVEDDASAVDANTAGRFGALFLDDVEDETEDEDE